MTKSIKIETASISYPFQRGSKRRRSNSTAVTALPNSVSTNRPQSPPPALGEVLMTEIRMEDWHQMRKYFELGFFAVLQIDCRFIAKKWIKRIAPKKQVNNPYNGGKDMHNENGNPELTKPAWWPPSVRHKEPDHLHKPGKSTVLSWASNN